MVAAKCLLRAIDAVSGWKSLSKLRDFQPAASSPFRVLHQPQGDKPKKHISSVYKVGTEAIFLFWRNVFYVYRLEEDVSPLKEGGGRLSVLALRACSYMSKAEGCHQGLCPHSLQGVFMVFVFFWWFCAQKGSPVKSWSCRKDMRVGKDKKHKNHLRLLQNVSCEPLMLRPAENPWASSDIFSRMHHHPLGFASTARR